MDEHEHLSMKNLRDTQFSTVNFQNLLQKNIMKKEQSISERINLNDEILSLDEIITKALDYRELVRSDTEEDGVPILKLIKLSDTE